MFFTLDTENLYFLCMIFDNFSIACTDVFIGTFNSLDESCIMKVSLAKK